MDEKQMTVGETEPITMEWLKGTVPSPHPDGLVAVVLTIDNPAVAELDPPNKALLMDPAGTPLSIRAKAPGTTTISALGVTGPPGVPVPAIVFEPVKLTVNAAPETFTGKIKIGA